MTTRPLWHWWVPGAVALSLGPGPRGSTGGGSPGAVIPGATIGLLRRRHPSEADRRCNRNRPGCTRSDLVAQAPVVWQWRCLDLDTTVAFAHGEARLAVGCRPIQDAPVVGDELGSMPRQTTEPSFKVPSESSASHNPT